MVDMEFETMMEYHYNGVSDEECEDDPREPEEPTQCGRCCQSFPPQQQMFDNDSCPHSVCVDCRFTAAACTLCEASGTAPQAVTQSAILKDLHSKLFKRRIVNKEHIVNVELSSEEGSVHKLMCTVCKRVFKKSNAHYHYMCATGEKPHVCQECGQRFVKKSHLRSHLNSHYGVRPFKCTQPKCKASFTQKDKLTRHMKTHTKEISLMCPLCDKLYTSQDILNFHMIKVHSSTKQFKCDQCPRTYKYPSSLRIHRLKHQARRDYMCEVCGKKYVLSAQLKLHKRSHVGYQRRPFKCNCGRRFISRRDKARHLLIHTSCHDYECSLCNTTFGRKDNLERHMKNFHQDGPPVVTKKVATVAPFNIKPVVPKKDSTLTKKMSKINKVEKPKLLKKDKLNIKSKPNCAMKSNTSECSQTEKDTKQKSNHTTTSNPTGSSNSNVCQRIPNQKQSVIVSPPQSMPQNRPSVIKTVPHLLPYRILPPEKRVDHSQTQSATSQKQINSLPLPKNSEKPVANISRVVENTTSSHSIRRRIPKDDALNRCFRIIHHEDTVRPDRRHVEDSKAIKGNMGAAVNTCRFRRPRAQIPSTAVSSLPVHANRRSQEIRRNQEIMHNTSSVRQIELSNNTTNSNIGGPSLPASLSESVLEANQEDNFPSSYTHMGEATYPSSSYTPYFDSDYFRDSINSYDSNVENLLPNDLDIGFQYINEELGYSETTFSSESRIIRYVSQETRIVRES